MAGVCCCCGALEQRAKEQCSQFYTRHRIKLCCRVYWTCFTLLLNLFGGFGISLIEVFIADYWTWFRRIHFKEDTEIVQDEIYRLRVESQYCDIYRKIQNGHHDDRLHRRFAGMGNLLKVLTREIENYPHFFLDFENAQPSDGEREVWNQVNAVLQDSESMLSDLQSYKGAGQEIRDAIQNPNDIQLQERAWNSVCPLVVRLKRFYEFSLRLEKALQSLLESLTCPPYTPTQHLEREQALAKQFAEILHFTLRFDELKMRNPAIQNDFSYYRRTLSRNRINNMHLDIESEVNNEMANRMSLFYAEATPVLKTLSNATTRFVAENKTLPIENTTDCLSTMASVCKVMLETPEYRSRFTSEESLMFCMRVMVGVIILYDHVHPVGAFSKASKIDMKGCIKVLREEPPDTVEGLLNALRFTTKHLNDESTSKQVRAMLQ